MVDKETRAKQFIEKAIARYGDKFDYSEVEYKDCCTKVCIICPKHGKFWVTPLSFLKGVYCQECKKEERKGSVIKFSELKRDKKYTTEAFIAKAKEKFGDKYDYSKTKYVNYDTKVCIICPEHGEMWMLPSSFLHSKGCPICRSEEKGLMIIKSQEDFIEKARKVHGDKYDYSKVVYTNSQTQVCIICPEHGEFWQRPYNHLKGSGCPKCSRKKSRTNESFISDARKVHGDKYDYSKVEYINNQTKVCIICPKHGEFWQTPNSHLLGTGCPECSGLKKWTTEKFITEARKVHGDKYDYSKTNYINSRTKVTITCPIHGDFQQNTKNHIAGQGCPKCGMEKVKEQTRKGTKQFVDDVKDMYGEKYTVLGDYENNKYKIEVFCNVVGKNGEPHGSFFVRPNDLLSGHGCPKCGALISSDEDELKSFIKENYDGEIVSNDRKILKGREIDIYLPELSIGFEYDGLLWHSEKHRPQTDVLEKLNTAESQGIKLITIFEDEWLEKKEICKSRILNYLGKSTRLYARKCQINEVSGKEASKFLGENHIQGEINAFKHIGLYYEGILVSLMSFGNLRKNLGQHSIDGVYEMLRFCNILNTSVIGGASRLLKYFIKTYHPKEIISYADRRWSNGNLYENLGFEFCYNTQQNYFYVKNNGRRRINRFSMRKDILVKKFNCPIDKTEKEFCQELGYYRIYDCGSKKYALKIKN